MEGASHNKNPQPQEFEFSPQDFQTISALVHKNYGLSLTESKKPLIYSRLSKRLRSLDIKSFRDYCDFVVSDAGAGERNNMLSALTTNVSHFYRERHHFDLLEKTVLPPLIERAQAGGRVRLWSAGCSAGQEPYSIAFTLLKLCPNASQLDLKILATDIDEDILARAKAGIYAEEDLGKLGEDQTRWMEPLGDDSLSHRITEDPKKLVVFTKLNLVGEWPRTNNFDVVFCRNVAIYFDRDTQSVLWQRLADRLEPGGHLIIGHSERLTPNISHLFDPTGITAYRKRSELKSQAAQSS